MSQIVEVSSVDGLDREFLERSSRGTYDRTLLDWSSRVAEPFCWAHGVVRYRFISPLDPNKFENSASKVKEIATRIFIALASVLSFTFAGTHLLLAVMVLGAVCKTLRILGIALQKDGFTHVRGLAPEKRLFQGQASAMTWNIRGDCTGLHYTEAGVVQWRLRLDRIVEKICQEDPDVLVLQAVYDTALVEALIEKLQDRYAHFFVHLGADIWGKVSGCMVMTKCAVQNFSHTDFANDIVWDKRGFATLEIKASPEDTAPCLRIIGAQLTAGKEAKKKRAEQVAQMIETLSCKTRSLPTLFVGNIHADRDSLDEGALLSRYLFHSYRDTEPTHTDQLVMQWKEQFTESGAMVDFISLFKRNLPQGGSLPVIEKGVRLIDCHLVKAFDEKFNTRTALSADNAVFAKFGGLKPIPVQ